MLHPLCAVFVWRLWFDNRVSSSGDTGQDGGEFLWLASGHAHLWHQGELHFKI